MGTLTALEKLVPVVLAFGCGVLLARRKVVPADSSRVFVDYAFLFAVPCYLFGNIYSSDLGALFDWRAILAYATTAALAVLTIGVLAGLGGQRDPRAIALRIMAGVQVNTAYFAVPVFITLFGNAAPIFPVLLFQVCVLTLVVISIMELGRPVRDAAQGAGPRLLLRAVGASLVTPVVLACNAGILLNLLSLHVPKPLLDGFSFVGDSASPVALFALGLHLGGSGLSVRGTTREEIGLITFKCLVFPLMTWAVCATVFGIDGRWLQYLVLIAAMPAPQNLFIFAQRYDIGVDMSAALVIKSSVAALLLLPLWMQWAVHVG
ncbi:AEC family transporter [Streptomyces sp. NBC_00203]|uniref:AEC family transporter n=1 Tax=Streptomyces sp. NBC_00203 TaxID=2975680 RepID=UPI003244DD5A